LRILPVFRKIGGVERIALNRIYQRFVDAVALAASGQLSQTGDKPMLNPRYVVVNHKAEWKIVQGGRRFPAAYTSKTQAVCSAIALAERHGNAGRRSEVLVQHEDGHFSTEWVFGRDLSAEKAARPIVSPDSSD
jgi:hypothetical protein